MLKNEQEIQKRFYLATLYGTRMKVSHQIKQSEFWGDDLSTLKVLDRFSYKGKGRPRKTDYCTLLDLQKKLNTLINKNLSRE